MEQNVPWYLKHQYDLYDRTPKKNITFSCNLPKRVVTIDNQGNCLLCTCDGWLPISVGHITEFDQIEKIWESDLAKKIQQDIDDKKFTWCSTEVCGIRKHDQIKEKATISLNFDESCNLSCPSCRPKKINFSNGPIYDMKLSWAKHIRDLLERFEQPSEIVMSGNGDPFASKVLRPIMMSLKPKPAQTFKLMTNGLLIKKLYDKITIAENISDFNISIDAGDKPIYERIRVGGVWENLIENLDFLANKIDRTKTKVTLFFVVQKSNVNSIDNFVSLVKKYQWHGHFQSLEDWNSDLDFVKNNILDPAHPIHPKVVQLLGRYRNDPALYLNSKILDVL